MKYKMTVYERIVFVALFFVLAAVCVALFGFDNDDFKYSDKNVVNNNSLYISSDAETGKLININTAGYLELLTLPGIGEKKAAAIIEYRSEHGKFASPEDIMNVPGIGNATYDGFKDLITVGE